MKRIFWILMAVAVVGLSSCKQKEELPEQTDLSQLTELSELGTVEYTVKKAVMAKGDTAWYKIGDRKVIYTIEASLKAGVDMSNFSLESIKINEEHKTVEVTLPHAKLLVLNIKPESEKKEWEKVGLLRSNFTAEERNLVLREGEKSIREDVKKLGILEDAEKNARSFFQSLFKSMGYQSVVVNFK